ncbi:MAG: poly(A) polymerase, partial [Lysobacterales bacterium]
SDFDVESNALLAQAMLNTDQRIQQKKSVTPAFLFASLLWQPVKSKTARLMEEGKTEFQALEQAGDEVISVQVRRTAIPRRFSAVTKQIWEMQARFRRTQGKRAMSVLHHTRFRAGYDFLLLRSVEDQELLPLVKFWTGVQKDMPERKSLPPRKRQRRRRRGGKPGEGT